MTMTPVPAAAVAGVERSAIALELPDQLTFEEWRDIGIPILEAGQSLMWWIGDWMNYGHERFDHLYTAAAEWTGLEYGTLANAKWVASRVPTSFRNEHLSFSHHAQVAPFTPEQQRRWLDKAEAEGWTVQHLKTEIRAWKDSLVEVKPPTGRPKPTAADSAPSAVPLKPEATPPVSSPPGQVTAARPDPSPPGQVTAAVRVAVRVQDVSAMDAALRNAAHGLREWFSLKGIDAEVDVLR